MKCRCYFEDDCPFFDSDDFIYDDYCCSAGIYPREVSEDEDGYPIYGCSLSREDIKKAIDKIIDIKKDLRILCKEKDKNRN